MENYLISIIVPIYNAKNYLDRCIQSLLKQTYQNIEILLIDDGSKDNSLEICNQYANKDERIKVIHQDNRGVSKARNCGLQIAKGDYIGFVDSDDFIEEDMYQMLLENMIHNQSDISICNMFYETNLGKETYHTFYGDFTFSRNDFPSQIYHNLSVNGYVCNKLYSRKLIAKENKIIEFNDNISVLEDNLFNYEIFDHNHSFTCCYSNKKLYHYIQIENSACNSKYDLTKLGIFVVREKEISILEKNGLDSDFLKMDYVVNFCKATIFINKYKLKKNNVYQEIYNQNIQYMKTISIKHKPLRIKVKYLIARYLPCFYRFKIYIKKENM